MAEKLKKSLAIAEEANQSIQDESRTNGEKSPPRCLMCTYIRSVLT